MSTAVPVAAQPRKTPVPRAAASSPSRIRVGGLVLPAYAHLVILWLFAPIFVMIVFRLSREE